MIAESGGESNDEDNVFTLVRRTTPPASQGLAYRQKFSLRQYPSKIEGGGGVHFSRGHGCY
jgi:hypothetical protein